LNNVAVKIRGEELRRDFKGAICSYCGLTIGSSEDHVFARQFFLERDRVNLPKVPACDGCNNATSGLEAYLATTLPFAGRHPQAVENLTTAVPKRLDGNRKVSREIRGSMKPAWIREGGGLYQPTSVVDFDGHKLTAWLKYVGRGLAWHHWKVNLRPGDEVSVMYAADMGSALFQSLLDRMRPENSVDKNLGNGTVLYRGLQALDPPQLTVWTIPMYGGVVLSDDRQRQREDASSCTMWWIFTGPSELSQTSSMLR
jgi:hypothetical protein